MKAVVWQLIIVHLIIKKAHRLILKVLYCQVDDEGGKLEDSSLLERENTRV